MLGALAMIGKYTEGNSVAILAPVLILGVPVFDTLFVMYVRWLRGIPVFLGSPDHFAIRLRHWALTVPQIVVGSYVVALILGGVAVAAMFVSMETALGLMGTMMALGVVSAAWLKRIDMSKRSEDALPRPASVEPARRVP
jgi:UDP-GlcNAc:undecaprenyl-phosphate GlcNAc-1-phosphate transferase